MEPVRIEGTNDYMYKGFVIGKYENENGGTRWNVELNGAEVAFDKSKLWSAQDWVDQHRTTTQ